ncbi:MAG: uncharacterized protein KVP18_002785 [Porospora cf. gigantea A]|uniref:uncharacterized protein n=1 Tax=Porospora cf. gigantea A TaxID=2853593 RepID=UPI003559F9D0|nr:MAG: hypothetical protein KVP18_002785 [Porospora cf. gigantea A]
MCDDLCEKAFPSVSTSPTSSSAASRVLEALERAKRSEEPTYAYVDEMIICVKPRQPEDHRRNSDLSTEKRPSISSNDQYNVSGSSLVCPVCEVVCKNQVKLHFHIKNSHPQPELTIAFQCPHCP